MANSTKYKMSPVLIIVIVILAVAVIGGVAYYVWKNFSEMSKQPSVASSSHCGMTIDVPAINSNTSFPVTVHGIIDNNNASSLGCSWQMSEGEAGTAQLYYWDQGNNIWQPINTPFIIPVSNWMTLGPVTFAVTVSFNNGGIGLASGHLMKITFTEENPSGEGTIDAFDWPLVLQ